MEDDISQKPQDATPRSNQRGNQQQQSARRQVERPDLGDVLTQLTQKILTMRREVANQPNQGPAVDVPEDPNYDWALLKLPAETKFPVPCTAPPKCITASLRCTADASRGIATDRASPEGVENHRMAVQRALLISLPW